MEASTEPICEYSIVFEVSRVSEIAEYISKRTIIYRYINNLTVYVYD